jgi:hypothetical protein
VFEYENVCRDVVAHFANPKTNPGARKPDLLKRRSEIEASIGRLVDAIEAGGEIPALVARIKALRQDAADVDRELATIEAQGHAVVTLESVRRTYDRIIAEWRKILLEGPQHVAVARKAVQKLVDARIEFAPEMRDGRAGTLVTVPGTLVRPIAYALNVDESEVVAHAGESRRGSTDEELAAEAGDVAHGVASPTGFEPVFWP